MAFDSLLMNAYPISPSARPLLMHLSQVVIRGAEAFRRAALKTEDGLKTLLTALKLQREDFARDIDSLIDAEEPKATPPASTAETAGARSLDLTNYTTLFADWQKMQSETVAEYESILSSDEVDESAKEILRPQLTAIRETRERFVEMRKRQEEPAGPLVSVVRKTTW
jgi:hypothetical protein